jgi:hypothetical protein
VLLYLQRGVKYGVAIVKIWETIFTSQTQYYLLMTQRRKIPRICQYCKNEFLAEVGEVNRGAAKFCSRSCYTKSKLNKQKCTCLNCNGEFARAPSQIARGWAKFCSKKCQYEWSSKHLIGEHATYWRGGPIKKICERCGAEFSILRAEAARGGGRFCSRKCRDLARTTKERRKCEICGGEFEINQYAIKNGNGRFCSRDCANKWHSEQMMGSGAPNWQGGISFEPYCPKFNKEFRERVRAFFGRRCLECGNIEKKTRHCVHHVNYKKEACCDDSIPLFVILCQSCHAKTSHNNRDHWQQHFTEIINRDYGGKCYFTKEEMEEYREAEKR